jgi:AcrR family transcriptional regulator
VDAAFALAARDGYADFSLDAVAERAGVTRNLVYRYFPRGRLDVFLAAVDRAGRELTDGWITDPEVPFEERLAANFGRFVEHAWGPSEAWLVHRQARSIAEPEVRATTMAYVETIVANISTNHLGSTDPPPLVRLGLHGFIAAAEVMLDEARDRRLPHEPVLALLGRQLVDTIAVATEIAG